MVSYNIICDSAHLAAELLASLLGGVGGGLGAPLDGVRRLVRTTVRLQAICDSINMRHCNCRVLQGTQQPAGQFCFSVAACTQIARQASRHSGLPNPNEFSPSRLV